MKKTRSFTLLIFSIILAGTLTGGFYGRKVQATPPGGEQVRATDIESSFSEALNIVEANYVDDIKHENLTKASIQNMLRTLDPHSNYFDSKEFQELQSEQHSQFFGIGVTINRRNDRVFILSAIKGTPAEQAGLRYGDAILKVDSKQATEWSTQEVLEHVRGPKGETVEIEVERAGVPKPLTFKIVRDAVPLPSIRNTYMIKPGVGYIALVGGFNHTTEDELLQAMESLKSQGMKSMVLDLRNNPGGLLTQAIKVSNVFLQKGQSIVSIKGRDKSSESRAHEASNPSPEDIPLVILI
ncbi:MAG: carboxyl-terminal processing protease, partial [bacterium]